MEIPDPVVWGGAVTLAGALVGYAMRIEARINERITRDEHQRICDRSNGDLTRRLDDVRRMLEESREDRRRLRDLMQGVVTEVAVLRGRTLQQIETEQDDREEGS